MTESLSLRSAGSAASTMASNELSGHSSEPDDVVVFELDDGGPRVAHERTAAST